ncbi:acetyl-CoA acetyltransferase [Vibrio halioticoli NBRC 102217]|uniref:Acetyl-CoA acetyltransferase n=1 Tax=Vibrio halioticoli NBRC 102217 TaxID=1219072 RepID=V5HKN4_9VIBR|nr:acetyl-CoA C-acetyltransferase [Vibrio halioticoli]GAD89785.1 acetyl-CoA acetyltransferase [Vibrio halioticoli NBRC 102217]
MKEVVIVSAKRTAIGAYLGAFTNISPIVLGVTAVKAALADANVKPEQVDNLIFGNVLSAGLGQNPARQVAKFSGIPDEATANVVSMVCGSGLKAVMDAVLQIQTGEAEIVVAGGAESMSNAAHILGSHRTGVKMGHSQLTDIMLNDGLVDAFGGFHMGITAENLASKYEISREEQDAYAVQSQNRAEAAITAGKFKDEIAPHTISSRRGDTIVDSDEFPRFGATLATISKPRPAFKKDGTVTAANASGLNDGAAAIVLMSKDKAQQLGLTPMVTIRSQGAAGVDPDVMGYAPVPASEKALQKAGLSVRDLDLVEANEAFASQALSVVKGLDLDPAITNVNGGAIAIGHPIGASGARILVTLVHELTKRNQRYGLATLCIGGGQGVALVVENENA